MKSKIIKILMRSNVAVKKGYMSLLLCLFVLPVLTFGQTPPPPGGSGGLPDSPLGVPFDSRMTLLLLLAGVVFAVITLKKIKKAH